MASVDTANTGSTTVNDPNNPNGQNPNVQGTTQNNNNQPQTSGGAGAVTPTGASNITGQVVGTNAPAQPFQNIASYLAANAPQSQQLAGQVANTVSQPIANTNSQITSDVNNFTGAVNSGFAPTNSALLTAVSENPASVVAENPQNVTNFTGQLNDKYSGPTDFTQSSDYSNLEANIAAAQAAAANTQSPAGIQTLLKSVEGPTTQGINNLDTVLLQNNPTNLATVQNAGAGASNLTPTLQADTAAENTLAANAGTTASNTATAAQDALATAQANEATNLNNEQNTIQGVVNEYNKSVNTINPVVSTIASAIQSFLAANPNITFTGSDPLSSLENLATVAMPQLATYASPEDYAQIAALLQLGDTNASQLPITSATANEAQTFNVPTQLQNALGQAPSVEAALQSELNGFGGTINTAANEFQTAEEEAYDSGTLAPQQSAAQTAVNKDQQAIQALQPTGRGANATPPDPVKLAAAQKQLATDQANLDSINSQISAEVAKTGVPENQWAQWGDVNKLAQSLQWVNPAETGYQSLVDQINSELAQLGTVGAPTLTYGPNTVVDPVTGVPIGTVAANDVSKTAPLAAAGATGAAGLGTASLAGAGGFTEAAASPLEMGVYGAAQTLPPAALAAYGASNIAQNAAANPVSSGISTLANTGLSLATLSLPPAIFNSIGKDITNIMNDIGNFFGNLF